MPIGKHRADRVEYTTRRPNASLAFQSFPEIGGGNSARNTLPSAIVGGLPLANHTPLFQSSLLFQSSASCPFGPGVASKASKYPRTILLMALHGASFRVRSSSFMDAPMLQSNVF